MPATTGMKGEGFYDRHSAAQNAAMGQVADWLRQAAETVALPPAPRSITVLDCGSSEGRNAVASMRVTVEALRRRTPQPIRTIFSDLPSNDFNQLFRNLSAVGPLAAEVYASAAAGSFYGPLMPPGSVHLATCFTALLWLDQSPAVPVRDFVSYRRPTPPRAGLATSAAQEAAFEAQAMADLQAFLRHRAREIVPGGKLVFCMPGDDAEGRCCDGIYDVINDACLDLVAANRVPVAAYEAFTIPVYFRTLAEVHTALAGANAFTIDGAESLVVPTPFVEAFRRTGDVASYAAAYAGFLRAFTEPIARAALVPEDGDAGIIDALFTRIRQRLEAEPERYPFRYVQVAACLTRRG